MAERFKNKYRIASHRKPKCDYSADGLYFLTIVTQNRICNLGDIVNMDVHPYLQLSDFGKIVEHEWLKSFEIRNELFLHEYVIMPNHLHTIVEINNKNRADMTDGKTPGDGSSDGKTPDGNWTGGNWPDGNWPVETHGHVSLPIDPIDPIDPINPIESIEPDLLSIKRNPPQRLPKSISSFMAGFKSVVNTKIDNYIDEHHLDIPKYNRNNHFFQPNYHDHIIRNHWEYINISNYIINNPKNWNKDKFNGNK